MENTHEAIHDAGQYFCDIFTDYGYILRAYLGKQFRTDTSFSHSGFESYIYIHWSALKIIFRDSHILSIWGILATFITESVLMQNM